MKTVIVIFGSAGHGKSTFAELLASRLRAHGSTTVLAFADPIKAAAQELLGIPLSVSYASAEIKESTLYYGKSVRHWLQWLGTEVGRDGVHKDVWVHRLADAVIEDPGRFHVVADGRFWNELRGLKPYFEAQHAAVRVINVGILRSSVESTSVHQSEAEVRQMWDLCRDEDVFDKIVENDAGLDILDIEAERIAGLVTT